MDAVYVLPSSSERGSGCPHVRPPQVAHDFIAFLTSLPGKVFSVAKVSAFTSHRTVNTGPGKETSVSFG